MALRAIGRINYLNPKLLSKQAFLLKYDYVNKSP
jgi:hypothetical protein